MAEELLQLGLFTGTDDRELRLNAKGAGKVGNYLDTVHKLAQMYGAELTLDGLSEAEALTVLVQAQVRVAAYVACGVRRELLGGTPDYWKWKAVCDEAFRKAVKASEPTAEVARLIDPEHDRTVADDA